MQRDLRILMLEDVAEEAEIIQRELQKAGLVFDARRVQTRQAFLTALEEFAPHLVLADSKLPAFDGRTALELATRHQPRIPVIMVTGELGDEAAVELLMAGASDYVLKDRLARLGSAVERVLQFEENRRKRERLEGALRDAAEEERQRLAKELHDGLGQELTGLAMLADGLLRQAVRTGAPMPPELDRLADIARHAVKTCRDIAHGLSPLGGTRGGLAEALRDLTARLTGPPGPQISLTLELHTPLAVSHEAGEHLYRIAQEALANAIKHAGADTVQVRLEADTHAVRLRVLDDGSGPSPRMSETPGLGLRTMRDRAEAIGGRLAVTARHEGGTAVICEAPQNLHSATPRLAVVPPR
jgi:two-component system, NarL family, sensor histidine kinase UhpB